MDFLTIRGYKKLSQNAQNVFERVYNAHSACVGNKMDWTPIEVKEFKEFIKVTFKNGEWLHYRPNGKWD